MGRSGVALGWAAVAAAWTALCLPAAHATVTIDPVSGRYLDETGRVAIFHGVNAVYKLSPFHPTLSGPSDPSNSLTPADMANLRDWGFNVVRLGVLWEGTEVAPRAYNTTYLTVMRSLVDAMYTGYGIRSIVDAHEDSLNRAYCGEGVPDWYVQTNLTPFAFPFPLPWTIPNGPDGYPNLTVCQEVNFGIYLFTVAEQASWGQLFNSSAIASGLAAFWHVVASAFNTSDGVLGYELFNEPQPGNLYANPLDYLVQGQGDRDNIAPLYQQVYPALRASDSAHIVMYEPAVVENFLLQTTGFTSGPGGLSDPNQAFAYHMYCVNQNATGDIINVTACADTLDYYWGLEKQNRAKVGGGSFLTEFGAVGPNPSSAQAISHLADLADQELESWTYWSYKSFDDITTQNPATETLYNEDGSLQMIKLAALSRTYAQAIAGVPGTITMSYDSDTGAFALAYTINPATTAPYTDIYYNSALHYPGGITTSITPTNAATLQQVDANHLRLVHAPGATGKVAFTLAAA